jgi:hypothetical protein
VSFLSGFLSVLSRCPGSQPCFPSHKVLDLALHHIRPLSTVFSMSHV